MDNEMCLSTTAARMVEAHQKRCLLNEFKARSLSPTHWDFPLARAWRLVTGCRVHRGTWQRARKLGGGAWVVWTASFVLSTACTYLCGLPLHSHASTLLLSIEGRSIVRHVGLALSVVHVKAIDPRPVWRSCHRKLGPASRTCLT